MKTQKISKNARELYSEKLSLTTIDIEVNTSLELIRSVIIQVRKCLLNDPTNMVLLDIKQKFDDSIELYLDCFDKIMDYLDSLNYEKS